MDFYLLILFVLFAAAAADLMVGVANDAVNFLNSAVGSRAGTRLTIMIVASLGVFLGTTFSGGIMEVARKGIFNPEMFVFHDVMIIFLAVMLTDIILLDVYNTFGLPTSTTVSIVFELLGGAVALAVVKAAGSGGGIAEVLRHINTANVLTIVSGIGLSIIFAFLFGSLIQFLTRVIFTFDYEKPFRRYGGLYCGIALTAMTYFILVKGAKGSVLLAGENAEWIKANMATILVASFAFWTVVWQSILLFTRINVLRIIVLIGTFSLALAFAANDLVNFIGAPLGALATYAIGSGVPGMDPRTFPMDALAAKVQAPTWILLAAGAVMVTTLWLSRKARSVTKTELSLGRQDEGVERFESSPLSRGLVGIGLSFHDLYVKIVPERVRKRIASRIDPGQFVPSPGPDGELPAFDLLRAAVNLMVASVLISFGTSLKLPLSTTFVTFSVAMSTSLVDKAWGRESAVYRVNGVVTVIGGWFFTAFMAFTTCFVFAMVIYFGNLPAILGLVVLALLMFLRTTRIHKKREKNFEQLERDRIVGVGEPEYLAGTMKDVSKFIAKSKETIDLCYDGLMRARRKKLKQARIHATEISENSDALINKILHLTKASQSEERGFAPRYTQQIGSLQIIAANLTSLAASSFNHIDNHHNVPDKTQAGELVEVNSMVDDILDLAVDALKKGSFGETDRMTKAVKDLKEVVRTFDKNQIKRIRSGKSGTRQSLLFIGTMSKAERVAEQAVHLVSLYREAFEEMHP
jgi:phosphate/sulfate permease